MHMLANKEGSKEVLVLLNKHWQSKINDFLFYGLTSQNTALSKQRNTDLEKSYVYIHENYALLCSFKELSLFAVSKVSSIHDVINVCVYDNMVKVNKCQRHV